MTITVSSIPSTKPALSYKKRLRRNCEVSFNDLGYRFGIRTDGVWVASSFVSDMPDLKFTDIHFAKAWLVKAGAFKEVA